MLNTLTFEEYIHKFNTNDNETVINSISNQDVWEWMLENIPFFECSDKEIEETYYFRWWVFRKHIKKTPEGYVITEFLPDVSWGGHYNAISCSASHHISEAKWLNNKQYAADNLKFWCSGSGSKKDIYNYSNWLIASVFEYCTFYGDYQLGMDMLPNLIEIYETLERLHASHLGLFWSDDDRDGMEYSISGKGLRPTINSYLFASAEAISRLAGKCGKIVTSNLYKEKAQRIQLAINNFLWDNEDGFYKNIPLECKDDPIIGTNSAVRVPMEEIGYIPWQYQIPERENDVAWKYLMDEKHFYTLYGPTTADISHSGFMNTKTEHECLWDGPSWPYATSQTLKSLITYLNSVEENNFVDGNDFMKLLKNYASCHYIVKDGKKINWIDENLNPFTGYWETKGILEKANHPTAGRGKDYNHSTFCDLVLSGAVGINVVEEGIIFRPLAENWGYFATENIICKGRSISVFYDVEGTRYPCGKGFHVFLDGEEIINMPDMLRTFITW